MKKNHCFLLITYYSLLITAFVGCGKKGDVVATFNGQKITADEFKERLLNTPASYRKYLSSPQGQKQFLELMIREKIVMSEAKKSGVSRSREYRDTLKKYNAEMKKRSHDFKENLMMEMYLKQLHEEKLNPSEDELKAYYQNNKTNFEKPVEMGVSHILLLDEKTAKEVLNKLKSGGVFEKLAVEYSADPTSAQRGGVMGVVKKGELDPALDAAALPLKVGGISDIVKTEFGYHIVKKNSEKLLPQVKFEDAKEEIRRALVKSKFDEWLKKVMDKGKIKIKEDVAKSVSESLWGSISEEEK